MKPLSQLDIVEEAKKLIKILEEFPTNRTLDNILVMRRAEFHYVHDLIIDSLIDPPKIFLEDLTIHSIDKFDNVPHELRGVYEVLYKRTKILRGKESLISKVFYYKEFVNEAYELIGGDKMTQEEIDRLFHPEWFEEKEASCKK